MKKADGKKAPKKKLTLKKENLAALASQAGSTLSGVSGGSDADDTTKAIDRRNKDLDNATKEFQRKVAGGLKQGFRPDNTQGTAPDRRRR